MSSNQEFLIKINDIIGKAWFVSLDDSEAEVLRFKLIEQNSSSSVLLEKEEEAKSAVTENPNKDKKPRRDINSAILRQLRHDLTSYFKGKHQQFRDFVKEVNTFIENKKLGIKVIEYLELSEEHSKTGNKSEVIEYKIEALIMKFEHETKLPYLQEVFDDFKKSFL
ncbi:hypothetical protein [Nostoc sp. FACHB-190]|uniref:hypothetical protein n=1 Tax=Nostoc sp. FACHB-190 TaxID=2692838 RepID=UPI0016873531|nr:hypothetical protein [Nostoc sp. FACHB-190]MBD2301799.1 hypothetical protein [Nostoc sp. FACHB-190]